MRFGCFGLLAFSFFPRFVCLCPSCLLLVRWLGLTRRRLRLRLWLARYNGAQRARNRYEPMQPATRALLDALFCDPNRHLAALVNGLPSRDGDGPTLLPRHGYACVD